MTEHLTRGQTDESHGAQPVRPQGQRRSCGYGRRYEPDDGEKSSPTEHLADHRLEKRRVGNRLRGW